MSSSIREIARQTGLSIATVSQALRGIGRVAPATREKVQAAALALGYEPHPLLSQAFSMVRQPAAKRYRETLGFIAEWKTEGGPEHQRRIFAGASERAASMGYKLESFLASGKPSEQRRLSRILRARGIRGLVITSRLASPQPRLQLDWQHFAAVEIGRTLWYPRHLHHVETADYGKTMEAVHLLKKVGYRRIGMAVEPSQNSHQHGIYYAAFLLAQLRQPPSQQVPIFDPTGPWDEMGFRRWIARHEPDVIFIHATVAPVIYEWLARMRLRVPRDISLFCVNIQDRELSGLRRNYHGMGRSAVEMVSLLLECGEWGIPENPRGWQVDGFWQAGHTLSRSIADYVSPQGHLRSGLLRPPSARARLESAVKKLSRNG